MRRFLEQLFPATAALLLLPVAGLGDSLDREKIAEIDRAMSAYRQAWLDDERGAILETLSEEIVLFLPGRSAGTIVGRDAVRDFWFPATGASYPVREYEISDQEIFGSGDFAILTGRSRLTWETVEAGKVTDRTTSLSDFMSVLRKEDGGWRIYRQMYQMRE